MKLSDYKSARREHWKKRWAAEIGYDFASENWLAAGVAGDRDAAEAAGVVWDPEEEPLPEQVEYREYNGISTGAIWPIGKVTMLVGSRKAIEREAVRRYNACTALERLVKELPERESDTDPCRWGCKLYEVRRILRGGIR